MIIAEKIGIYVLNCKMTLIYFLVYLYILFRI